MFNALFGGWSESQDETWRKNASRLAQAMFWWAQLALRKKTIQSMPGENFYEKTTYFEVNVSELRVWILNQMETKKMETTSTWYFFSVAFFLDAKSVRSSWRSPGFAAWEKSLFDPWGPKRRLTRCDPLFGDVWGCEKLEKYQGLDAVWGGEKLGMWMGIVVRCC